jgi:NADH-quinone oxidoreductase subunit M
MLSLIVFIPLLAALGLLFVDKDNRAMARAVALGASSLSFLISIGVLVWFKEAEVGMQFTETLVWVKLLNIRYQVGVDGISVLLLVLTTFLSVIAIFFSLDRKDKLRNFLALMLALEAGTLGVFVALDTILFYVFWELMLIPTYYLIGI